MDTGYGAKKAETCLYRWEVSFNLIRPLSMCIQADKRDLHSEVMLEMFHCFASE